MRTHEKLVISGIAGRFPECENVDQFKEALLNGVDLVTDNDKRYPAGIYGVSRRSGVIPEINKFDNTYFEIHATLAQYSDPRHRILLETVYESIVDAGYNPKELRGTKTGVYVGITPVTTLDEVRKQDTRGYTNLGYSSAIAANRVSYCFDFKGPSFSLDTACSSGMYALANAVRDLNTGNIDSAVVAVSHIVLVPEDTKEFHTLHMLSPEGKCKVFQGDRDGYVRSETVGSVLIQRESDCRRIYATILGAKVNADGYKKEGLTFPSSEGQMALLKELYMEIDIDPMRVSYVEAHGTGTPAGDIQECTALSKIFGNGRSSPLPVGSVKSNMGHSETASALSSLTKVIIAMESGVIPANLHVSNMDVTLPGISDNTLKVMTENLPWKGGLVGVNSFGFGGANAHVVLKSFEKEKSKNVGSRKNRLVCVSGRTEEAVAHFLKGVEDGRDDEEFLALVDEIHKNNFEGHPYRGFVILGEKPAREIKKCPPKKRPVWFIYPGMGSQWMGMGKDLMRIKVFRDTFLRCAEALKPFDLDLEAVIMDSSPKHFENFMNAFVAITSIQVALTDVLFSLGIYPDGIAGHSMGEIGCGYADGSLTPEEAVLLSYARGKASISVPLPKGLMAAVGLTREEAEKILPENTFIACENGKSSLTISGLEAPMRDLVETLKSRGVFAKIVDTGGIAFHTKFVEDAGPMVMDMCKGVIKTVQPRSERWVSTSVPDDKMDEPWAGLSTQEYYHRNFLNPVLFTRVYEHVPKDAVVLEVAPHALLQAILKRELGPEVTNVGLASRLADDNEHFLLSAIGRVYLEGAQLNLRNLYPEVSFPVGRGTKMLSPLVKWDHSVSWFADVWKHLDYFGDVISVNVSDEKYSYLRGHYIDGRVLMPATGYLELVWRVLAKFHLKEIEQLPVVIQDVKFKRATVLPDDGNVQFIVNIFKQSGNFEVFEGGSVVASGKISVPKDVTREFVQLSGDIEESEHNGNYPKLSGEDLYKECHLRRYMYKDSFKAVTECDVDGLRAKIQWSGMFTSFMDAMMHPSIIREHRRDISLPTSIEQIVIDPITHLMIVNTEKEIPITMNCYCEVIRAGGIEIVGLHTSKAPRRQKTQPDPYLEVLHFARYASPSNKQHDMETSLRIAFQIIAENCIGVIKQLKICGIDGTRTDLELGTRIKSILDKQTLTRYDYVEKKTLTTDDKDKFDVIMVDEESVANVKMESVFESLAPAGFVLYFGHVSERVNDISTVTYRAGSTENQISLLRPRTGLPKDYKVVKISNTDFGWLEKLKELRQDNQQGVVYLVSQGEPTSGIIGLIKCLVAESIVPYKCVFIDQDCKEFSVNDHLFRKQLENNLTINILRANAWGTFTYLPPFMNIKTVETASASLSIDTLGDLSTFKWIQRPIPSSLPQFPPQELADVYYSALNFRDVLVATGSLQIELDSNATAAEVNLGFEYSGVTSSGRRIMGMTFESVALQVRVHPSLTWEVPETWSLEEAATVPVVYTTCFYAMLMRGQMKRGESILIHAGTGGIGLAAISIALSMDATVFTTVSTTEKKEFLKKKFPGLEDRYIGNSRDKTFHNLILNETKGRGVDLVLNSLAGDLFQASLKCIAKRGRFLEIGKMDFVQGSAIDSSMFLKDCSFHGIQLDDHFGLTDEVNTKIHELLNDGINNGVVKPLPTTVFGKNEAEQAFRFLSTGKHKGKVLIKIRDEDPISLSITRTISAEAKVYFDPSKSYILVGGLGGFGLELTSWMIERGATKIILNSRSKALNGYQGLCLKKWALFKNVVVKVSNADTGSLEGAEELVTQAQQMGPVGGVFNTALVLRDSLLENQTKTMFEEVFKGKIVSGRNMDVVTRNRCPDLEYFVMFSSIAGGRGNAGQTNYGMANSALERLCEKRRQENLPGLAIQWGPIGDVGFLAGYEDKVVFDMLPQHITSCLRALEKFMLGNYVVGSSVVFADNTVSSTSTAASRTPVEAAAHILGIKDLTSTDKSCTLSQLGMDSLMVAEIKQTLYRNFQLEFSVEEIRQLTLEALISLGENKNTVLPKKVEQETPKAQSIILSEEAVVTLNEHPNCDKIVFFVHPVEGRVDAMRTLAKWTKATVYGFQCTRKSDYDTIPDLARHFIEVLKEKQSKGPYSICGYSYGVILAMEIALQLEEQGKEVNLVFIDGSVEFAKNVSRMIVESKIDSLKEVCETFVGIHRDEFANIVAGTWEEALRDVSTVVATKLGMDWDLINCSIVQYYNRGRAAFFYEPKGKLRGMVTLIRTLCDNPYTSANDYGLQELCQKKVDVVKVNGNHYTIVLEENAKAVSEIINRTLI